MLRRSKTQPDHKHRTKATTWFLIVSSAFALSFSSCVAPASNQPTTQNAAPTNVASNVASSPTPAVAPTYLRNFSENPDFDAEGWLTERVKDKNLHSVLIASLLPGRTLARHNIDQPFNPASVVKLATTLVALKKLGADHRFNTSVLTDGKINEKGTLEGDLYFAGGARSASA